MKKFFIITLLFGLLFASGEAQAQMKQISGYVLQKQFGNQKPKPFEEDVQVFAYNTVSMAKKDLASLNRGGAVAMNYDAETTTDENGYFTIKVAPTGAIIVSVGGVNHQMQEVKKRLEVSFVIDNGIMLQGTTVTAKARVATVDSIDVVDTGSTIECSSIITIPQHTGRGNARCVFQPVVIDCQTGDTVEFRQPRVFDGIEYRYTQDRRMGFNMGHDALAPYIQPQRLTQHALRVRWSDSIKKRNFRKTYTCMAGLRMSDYTGIFYAEDKQISSCMARRPFQFLEWTFGGRFDLDPLQYKETPRAELRDGAERISLSFVKGRADLDPDNPQNDIELERLNRKLREIDQSEDYQMRRIALTGYASPDGNYENNLRLAQRRSEMARNIVARNFRGDVYIYTNPPVVIGWDVVADTLDRHGHADEAEQVRAVVRKYSGNKSVQSVQMTHLPFYQSLVMPILPSLRIFKCEYAYQTTRALEPEEILDNYLHNPDYREGGKKRFSHYDYWHLFQMVTDTAELEHLYLRAYRETKENETRPWVYAANKLAISYIRHDTSDVNVLRSFIDINVPRVNLERHTFAGHKYMMNLEEVVANQIIGYYTEEHADTAYYLSNMLPDKPEYEELKAFSTVRCMLYKKNKTPEQQEAVRRAISVVEGTSPINRIVMLLATNRTDDAEAALDALPDNDPRKWYMKAIVCSRKLDMVGGATNLNLCFQADTSFRLKMAVDGEISDDVKDMWEMMYGD